MTMGGMFNITEAEETMLIQRSPTKTKKNQFQIPSTAQNDQKYQHQSQTTATTGGSSPTKTRDSDNKFSKSCFTLPMLRQNEIKDLGVNMETREAKINKIEETIHRLRETISTSNSSTNSDDNTIDSRGGAGGGTIIGIIGHGTRRDVRRRSTDRDGGSSRAVGRRATHGGRGDADERQQASLSSEGASISSSSSASTDSAFHITDLQSSSESYVGSGGRGEGDGATTSEDDNSTKQGTRGSTSTPGSSIHSRSGRSSHRSGSHSGRSTTHEALRQKVRDKENALQAYIQRNSNVMEQIDMRTKQINQLISTLEEKDVASEKLQNEIERLMSQIKSLEQSSKAEIDKERLLAFNRLTTMERNAHMKETKMEYYESKIHANEKEMKQLQQELHNKAQRVIELEVNLETHNLRYVSHQQYVKQVDKEALEMSPLMPGIMDGDEDDGDENYDNNAVKIANKVSTKVKNQIYIQKLKTDLADMEKRYMQEKTTGMLRISSLERDNKTCRKRLISMARHVAASRSHSQQTTAAANAAVAAAMGGNRSSAFERVHYHMQPSVGKNGNSATTVSAAHLPSVEYMKKRLDLVENENIDHIETIDRLRVELKDAMASLKERAEKDNRELSWLRLENESLTVKIAELERDLEESIRLSSSPVSSGSSAFYQHQQKRREDYNLLEKKLDQSVVEILNLVEQVYAKDRAITSLRSTIVEERLARQEMEENLERQRILKLATAAANGQIDDGVGGKVDPSSVLLEIQSRFDESQKQLKQKEGELRLIRGKADAQALKLQAQVESSKRNSEAEIPDHYFI